MWALSRSSVLAIQAIHLASHYTLQAKSGQKTILLTGMSLREGQQSSGDPGSPACSQFNGTGS